MKVSTRMLILTKKNKASSLSRIDREETVIIGQPIGVKTFEEIKAMFKNINEQYRIILLNNNVWKLNMADITSSRNLSLELQNKEYQWYTNENKMERSSHGKGNSQYRRERRDH